MGPRSPDLSYAPYGELEGGPNVIVDGAPTEGTVLCLSHWPGIGGPPEFAADLSAEMAFLYLAPFDRHGDATVVSNNHFDQDGLVGVFALSSPEHALARRDLLVEVARAGDFAVTRSRVAARVSMVVSAYADPRRSPLGGLPEQYDAVTSVLYGELLGRLPEICDRPERFRHLWAQEDETLTASEAALASGVVTINECPEVDLAVVTAAERAPGGGGHRFGGQWVEGLHPIAVHNATARGAVLTVRGRHYEFAYRYESWVQLRTHAMRPRGRPHATGRAAHRGGKRPRRNDPMGGWVDRRADTHACPRRWAGERAPTRRGPGPGGGPPPHGPSGVGSLHPDPLTCRCRAATSGYRRIACPPARHASGRSRS